MIDAKVLLADLTRLLKRLEDDLRERALSPASDVPELRTQLQAEWQAARDAGRTAETFESWAEQAITQAGVHWLLSCVFLRFIEDNGLVERPWIAGTPQSGRLALARDRHDAYFRVHPHQNDRDYLFGCFREAGALPGLHTFFDGAHNPVFRLGISGDAAMAVMQFWQEVAADSGALIRDFNDPSWNTRFLGDLYQDLSEAARKRYALLQTPEFVEEFILDRTLTPAIHEFGYREVRLIDPTCGSGHFLLGGFHRLVEQWSNNEPGRNRRDIAQQALDAVAGVDLNPFAVAIARFRLLLAALQASDVQRLAGAPDFRIHVAIGDSLLHGRRFGLSATEDMFQGAEHFAETGLAHAYASEDLAEVQAILGRQYHAVVGNPPYIVVRDAALNAAYRRHYASCHMKYSLGAPFTERFFELAVTGRGAHPAGFVGLITANSFMKREFGAKLIEQVLPRLDLSHVVDTSGAYIPGHGTPTVILFGRHRAPVGDAVRTVMGIKGEPSTPEDPAHGLVWSAIVGQIDRAGSESEFVSVADTGRAVFAKHPWSIGGGGAADVKDSIEAASTSTVGKSAIEMGVFGMTNADEVMLAPQAAFARQMVEAEFHRPLVVGDLVRDWSVTPTDDVLFPYCQEQPVALADAPRLAAWLWPCRTVLGNRATFGKSTYFDEGRPWWAWHQVALRRISTPLTITFGEIATHNHFVLDRGGKVFNRTAPVIKLPAGAGEDEHLGLLGLLNSSVACFWLQQVCHNKGRPGADVAGADERYEMRYAINATNVAEFPLTDKRPHDLAQTLDRLAQELAALSPAALLDTSRVPEGDNDASR
ncbi:MAG: BREX-2 system adenine-specific DNA-methyltransferase PglX [Accumulibacter sp.]|uniref:BREX-2 system adenine-specific DNA-methyltransferase PglX n=1 Tax=Accumulibacter sp. TaxID=2053492 RepID=UPI00331504FA